MLRCVVLCFGVVQCVCGLCWCLVSRVLCFCCGCVVSCCVALSCFVLVSCYVALCGVVGCGVLLRRVELLVSLFALCCVV